MVALIGLWLKDNWRGVVGVLAVLAMILIPAKCSYDVGSKRAADRAAGTISLQRAQLTQCHDNTAALQASLDGQNRAVDQMKADSDKRLQASSDALHGAQKGRESAEARAAKLLALKPAGIDACARMMDADRAVLESLQ